MRSAKDYFLLFLKGFGMGSADVVPGVSGGTVAFITGIYEELLKSISSFDRDAILLLKDLKFRQLWMHINGAFILPLVFGILLSAVSLAKLISHLLETNPIQVWSFFFGLIIISSIMVAKEIQHLNMKVVLSAVIGIAFAFGITIITPANTPNDLWFIFICGALAICAMILPGISGAFILLILGKYTYIITSLKDFNIPVIVIFISGCLTGLFSFSRVISFFLKKFHNYAVALLAGFMLGSLNKIWPWKKAVLFEMNHHGEQIPVFEKNLSPMDYLAETGNSPLIVQATLFMSLGFILILFIEKAALIGKSANK